MATITLPPVTASVIPRWKSRPAPLDVYKRQTAADHGGFELKEAVKAHLDELGLEYIDFGTHSTASVDDPDMALPA